MSATGSDGGRGPGGPRLPLAVALAVTLAVARPVPRRASVTLIENGAGPGVRLLSWAYRSNLAFVHV